MKFNNEENIRRLPRRLHGFFSGNSGRTGSDVGLHCKFSSQVAREWGILVVTPG